MGSDFVLPFNSAIHDPVSANCLPPFGVKLEDYDVAQLILMAHDEDNRLLDPKTLVVNFPMDFQADGVPRENRPIRGRPALTTDAERNVVCVDFFGGLYIFRGGDG